MNVGRSSLFRLPWLVGCSVGETTKLLSHIPAVCTYVLLAKTISQLTLLGSREGEIFITQMSFDYPDITRGSRHGNQRKKWQETEICLALALRNVW